MSAGAIAALALCTFVLGVGLGVIVGVAVAWIVARAEVRAHQAAQVIRQEPTP